MSKVIVTKELFQEIKKGTKLGVSNRQGGILYGVSRETVRKIKKCPSWNQWQQDKINLHVQRSNEKYLKTFRGRLDRLLGRI